jgi:hypothetical protein
MPAMRNTLGRILALALLLAAPWCLSAYGREDFDRVADFTATVKTVAGLTEGQARALSKRLLLLDGTIASLQFLNAEEASFAVELELVGGEWIGTEDVKIYRCRVRFRGPEYFRRFPRRAPHSPGPDQIAPNDRVLILARLAGREVGEDGTSLWVLEGLHVRPLR